MDAADEDPYHGYPATLAARSTSAAVKTWQRRVSKPRKRPRKGGGAVAVAAGAAAAAHGGTSTTVYTVAQESR